jgi:hypothetical protein
LDTNVPFGKSIAPSSVAATFESNRCVPLLALFWKNEAFGLTRDFD